MTDFPEEETRLLAEQYAQLRGLSLFDIPTIIGKRLGECTKPDLEEVKALHERVSEIIECMERGEADLKTISDDDLWLLRRASMLERDKWNWAVTNEPME
jgi:hypothetical protein